MASSTHVLCIVGGRKVSAFVRQVEMRRTFNSVKPLKGNCFKGINVAKPLIWAFGKPQMTSN